MVVSNRAFLKMISRSIASFTCNFLFDAMRHFCSSWVKVLVFLVVGCNKRYTSSSGTIYSPMYPSDYPNNAVCTYNITDKNGEMVYLGGYFGRLSIGDTLALLERDPSSGHLIQKMLFYFAQNYMILPSGLLQFKSDNVYTSYGFALAFRVTKGLFSFIK